MTVEGNEVVSNGFVTQAKLLEIRPQSNRPTSAIAGYKLQVIIKKDNAESNISVALPKGNDVSQRYSTSLKVSDVEGFVNCDLRKHEPSL